MIDRITRRTLSAALLSAALGAVLVAPIARADDGPPPPPPPIPLAPDGTLAPEAPAAPSSTSVDTAVAVDVVAAALVASEPPAPPPPAAPPSAQPPVAAPPPGVVPAPPPPGEGVSANPALDPSVLKDLVGRVALYPDVVLASLLPAATAPLDVIEAAALVKQQGGHVAAVPANCTWEPAVQAMLQYPDALLALDADVPWMRRLGAAVEADQDAVLAAIQAFRADASKAGNLKSSPQATVTQQPAPTPEGDPIIVIEPAQPNVIYVPSYDPVVVCQPYYSSWPLYTWGVGTYCGPYGPWGWSTLAWGFGWGWFYGSIGYGYGGGYYGGYHHGHHDGHHGGGYYHPRSADVVGHSPNYGPSSIRHSNSVNYHSNLRNSTTTSTFQPRSARGGGSAYGPRSTTGGAATGSSAFAPGAGARHGNRAAGGSPQLTTQGQAQGARSRAFGPTGTARSGATSGTPAGTAGTWNNHGTQFRRQGGTGTATATTPSPTMQPRSHYTPRTTGGQPAFSTQGAPQTTRSFAPQGQRTYQPQAQPRSFSPNHSTRSYTPSTSTRSFSPGVSTRSYAPSFGSASRSFSHGGSSSWGRSGGFSSASRSFSPSFGGGGSRGGGGYRGGGRGR